MWVVAQIIEINGWNADGEYVSDSIELGSLAGGSRVETRDQAIEIMRKRSGIVEIGDVSGC